MTEVIDTLEWAERIFFWLNYSQGHVSGLRLGDVDLDGWGGLGQFSGIRTFYLMVGFYICFL